MNSDQLIQALAGKRVAQCVFHSPDFATVHQDNGHVLAAVRRDGQWSLVDLRALAQLEARYEKHMAGLGAKLRARSAP